jgi:hypothetical protein
MELIDGIPLEEHLNNLKDKNEIFAEERIWKILMQVSKSEWLLNLKSTCDVNLLSKLSIIFKEWRVTWTFSYT